MKGKAVLKNNENHKQSGNSLCGKGVKKKTSIFKYYRTNQLFKIFHDLKCENLIYLFQCWICKLQYVGSMVTFNIHVNNHRKDVNSEKSILPCKHVNESNHSSQQHAEFTLIEQLRKQTATEEARKLLSKTRKFLDFKFKHFIPRWIK